MTIDPNILKALVEDELARVADARVTSHIRSLLTEPRPELRDWDYGEKGQQYTCWIVLEHHASGIGIAYCESGFGPEAPWGHISLNSEGSMGMDSGWFTTLLQAYRDSAAADLPICRVLRPKLLEFVCRLRPSAAGTKHGSRSWRRDGKTKHPSMIATSALCLIVDSRCHAR